VATPGRAPIPADDLAPQAAAAANAANPLLFAQEVPEAGIGVRMMEGLDKYRQMSRQRAATPAENVTSQWQSDPAVVAAPGGI
jgi:hypothetical protein